MGCLLKALIVEDESISALWMKSMLKILGFSNISITGQGEDAVKIAIDDPPDIVFLDIRLAGRIDGLEVARRILAVRDMHIVFLTAYSEEIYREQLREIKSLGLLKKPFGMDDVEEILQKNNLLGIPDLT